MVIPQLSILLFGSADEQKKLVIKENKRNHMKKNGPTMNSNSGCERTRQGMQIMNFFLNFEVQVPVESLLEIPAMLKFM